MQQQPDKQEQQPGEPSVPQPEKWPEQLGNQSLQHQCKQQQPCKWQG